MFTIQKRMPRLRVGLDIQPDVLRLVALDWAAPYQVRHFGEAILAARTIDEGKCEKYDQVIRALRELAKETNTQGQAVCIALPFRNVILKTIQLPSSLSDFECEIEIENHLSRYLPGMTDAVQFDFIRSDQSAETQKILLAATQKERMDFYIDLVSQAGFRVKAVDIDIYALSRAVFSKELDAVKVMIHFQQDEAIVIVLQAAQLIFHEIITLQQNESVAIHASKIQQCLRIVCSLNHNLQINKIIFAGVYLELEKLLSYFKEFAPEIYSSIPLFEKTLHSAVTRFAKSIGLALWGVKHGII